MTFKSYLKELVKTGATYLASVTPSKRKALALRIAEEYFEQSDFVPGFPDLLIVTSKSQRYYGENHIRKVCSSTTLPSVRYKPDLLWVDDLPSKEVTKITKRYSGIPTIYSGCKPSKNGFEILVDTREQRPLFKGNEFKRHALYVGDYTTTKLIDRFHIERKSPEDLYGTITSGHYRFRNELLRADQNDIKLVMVVESRKKDFVKKLFDRRKITKLSSEHIEKIINTVEKKYGLEIVWCSSREAAKRYTIKRLKQEQK